MFNFAFGGDPFGEMGGHSHGPAKDVDNSKFYELLGVSKTATEVEIKKAFRKLAVTAHPDKGGDPQKFKEITKAYEVLSDAQKRERYDRYGEEGIDGPDPGANPFDGLFGFGRGGGGGGNSGPRKGKDVVFPLKVSLEELYTGCTKKLRLTKKIICSACEGRGGKADSVKTCSTCKGRGVRVITRQLGPGMIQQMQAACNDCNGDGKKIDEKDKCTQCNGDRTTKETKQIEVGVQKGMRHGEKITFRNEGDELPGIQPGDVVVVVQEQKHETFHRSGPHLVYKKKITLLEALTSFEFTITHLDGHVLKVASKPGMIYKPGDVMAVRDHGMPLYGKPLQNGNMYIEFDVEFPQPGSIDKGQYKALAKILPGPKESTKVSMDTEFEEVNMEAVDIEAENQRFRQEREDYQNEQEQNDEEQGPRCRTQ